MSKLKTTFLYIIFNTYIIYDNNLKNFNEIILTNSNIFLT